MVIARPTLAGGTVYLVSGGNLYALDAATGHLRWTDTKPGRPGFEDTGPAVAGGTVYAGGYGTDVYALDAATGHLRWAYANGNTSTDGLAVAGGTVYVDGYGTDVYALDAATGQLRWTLPPETTRSPT